MLSGKRSQVAEFGVKPLLNRPWRALHVNWQYRKTGACISLNLLEQHKMEQNHISRHFGALSDEALKEIRREDLIPEAVVTLDTELAERKLSPAIFPHMAPHEELPAILPKRTAPWWSNLLSFYSLALPIMLWLGSTWQREFATWKWTSFCLVVMLAGWLASRYYAIAIRTRFNLGRSMSIGVLVLFVVAHLAVVATAVVVAAGWLKR